MKKHILLLLFAGNVSSLCSQDNQSSLPAEFRDVAIRAFQQASPALKQWLTEAASQHPAGKFDTSWSKKMIRARFGAQNVSSCSDLFMVMLEYMRMQAKETREDRTVSRQDTRLKLAEKEGKLKTDNKQIDQQTEEARQKAEQQMNAARIAFWLGIVNPQSAGSTGVTATKKEDSVKFRVTKPARVPAEKGGSGNDSGDQQKKLNDAVNKLLAQISNLSRITELQ